MHWQIHPKPVINEQNISLVEVPVRYRHDQYPGLVGSIMDALGYAGLFVFTAGIVRDIRDGMRLPFILPAYRPGTLLFA